ncbi:alpha/beta fold hydrolase [Nocardia sp. NPDC057227]|uniref:alpha/beta fold hydrolase n=1 Tax=Nocardia sp. NPDC057227 TaxID=3346056 RepID=UPI00363CB865
MVLLHTVRSRGADVRVRVEGSGPPALLLHGWPHTRRLWDHVLPGLAEHHTVIAPDLPGLGESTAPNSGYRADAIATDLAAILDAAGADRAAVVAIDLAVQPAFLFAMTDPRRVTSLTLMEGLLPPLPGAEEFLADPPWWFGFHGVPGLAETVLPGGEDPYLSYFLTEHTFERRGIDPEIHAAFVRAYTGRDALARGFGYYRAAHGNAELIARATASARLTVPALALGGNVVGSALARQLSTVADDLTEHIVPDCGHLVPLEQPGALLDVLVPFLGRGLSARPPSGSRPES